MKFALCLYGISPFETRTYGNNFPYSIEIEEVYKYNSKSYPSLKYWVDNFLNINQLDVYMHCWVEDQDMRDKLLQTFKPKKYLFEKIIFDDTITSCCNSMFKSTNLIEDDYDFVFLCRFDVVWFNKISLKDFDFDKFYVSYYRHWERTIYDTKFFGTSDIYFAGSLKKIKLFTDLFLRLNDCPFYKDTILHDHHLIKRWWIDESGLINITERKLNPGLTSDDRIPEIDFNIESRVISFTHKRIP